ncbi:hypothetical protein E8E12_007644 [Didymella heteroderae]|uniref:HECT-type E3 ubiquitin transferase n=1 Tax=Didymella heteroderae TaxID=1769908 RepID=A0A9P4WXG3_9PLEO|nr:hypothetical protein E8E12_007644 [Didymella heteroderae]
MTSSEGGPQRPRDEPRSLPCTSTASSDVRSTSRKDSPHPLERRLSNVIDVQDPARIIECSQLERQRKFQYLVRRYLSQILYGCKSAYCDTTTCFSRNKRGVSKPYRPPTLLTARALAHFLASQSNPYRGLCPRELKVAPGSLEIEGAVDLSYASGSHDNKDHARQVGRARTTHAVARAIDGRHQAKKDTKSIGQNLYDSVSLIYSYSKSIPSPRQALETLRASSDDTQQDERAGRTNESAVTELANTTPAIARQSSQQNLRTQSQAQAARDPPQVLSNGQHIHKVPYRPTAPDQFQAAKNSPALFHDNTMDAPKMLIKKTGRKSFTLGGSIPLAGPKRESRTSAPQEKVAKPRHDNQISIPIVTSLNCEVLDQLKHEAHIRQDIGLPVESSLDQITLTSSSQSFVDRSLFYTLSNTETLLHSFRESSESFQDSPLPHLNSARLAHSFRDWSQRNGALIFDSLSVAVDALFTRPPSLGLPSAAESKPAPSVSTVSALNSHRPSSQSRYLDNYEAAHIVMICIHALTSHVPVGWPRSWAQLRSLRSWGVIVPSARADADNFVDPYVNIIDAFEYEPAKRLVDRLLKAVGVRTCFEHILAAMQRDATATGANPVDLKDSLSSIIIRHLAVVERVALESKRTMKSVSTVPKEPGWTVTATFIEWLKTTIITHWNGKVEINKWSNVGTAVMLLHEFHEHQRQLNVWSRAFKIPYLHEHMNAVDDPVRYLDWKAQPNTLHLLQYPELHPTDYLVKFFRVINLSSMMAQYDHTQHTHQMMRQFDPVLREPYLYIIKKRLKVTMNDYLILDVTREQPLKDTLDQLWKQERTNLLKPLKIKLGQQEGEVGLDHGGVTYEFFRVILSEAFAPEYGMFTVDSKTQMTWFQPGSLEPLWKFKMLGVLFSLAIYNGITLPVTFPLVFYKLMLQSRFKFLDDHSSLDYIRDGWPDLAKSFETLLDWKDGNVADVFVRDYAFSYEVFGQRVDITMAKRDINTPAGEAPLITNENRGAFVRDYVTHLILHTVRPQLKAFKKGFYTCLNARSLELFTPKILKKLVEGEQDISIPELRACATYEDYDAAHPTVQMFWDIVKDYSQQDATRLLEFVTASDRVPVIGYKSLTFNIVRMGNDSEQLPTSSTCFGKLYLPEYKDSEKMRRKLELAIQNAKGFGVV